MEYPLQLEDNDKMRQPGSRILATYHVRCESQGIEARARAIAIEQSVELPLDAIDDASVLDAIVGRVDAIADIGGGTYEVRIALGADTAPPEAGQILNMVFGNTSLQDDTTLSDIEFPADYLTAFAGPRVGLAGLRTLVGAGNRALTATALKPQGLAPDILARLAGRLARGGLDIIKDDHGLADQRYCPFVDRVAACAAAVRAANAETGRNTLYAPSLSGDLDQLRRQMQIVRDAGLGLVLAAPMVIGLPAFHTLAREAGGIAIMAHPSMGGAARIAPPLLIGRLFRLLGADATIFPNHGGRFAYTAQTCREIAMRARQPWGAVKSTAPTPAGGMAIERVAEMLDFYGHDCILLIGGSLLAARDRVTEAAADFVKQVERHEAG